MSLTIGELVGFVRLDDSDFNRGIDRSEGKFRQFGGAMVGAAAKAAVGAGVALAGVGAAGIKEFASLERGMNEVFTLLPGISQDAMGQMTDDVRGFAKEMGVLPNDVVPALYQSLSAGVPPDNVFEFLETANKAAVGGVTDLETAVDGITSVVNAYGSDVMDATKASDLMFTAVRLGKTNFEELSASLFNVLPTASALGVGFGDVTAAMAEMTAQGVPTSVATTQLRQLLVELSKDGSKASDAFKEAAGVGLKEFIAQGGNTADALDIMRRAAEESGVGINDLFGSVEAGNAALALAADGTESYRGALAEMADAAGATDQAHQTMDRGLGRAWERIKANVMVALGEIGEHLAPTFQAFADWVVANMPAITDFVVGAFRTIAGFVTSYVMPVFQALVGWWDDNGPAIVAAAQELWAGLSGVFAAVVDAVQTVTGWFQRSEDDITGTFTAVQGFAGDVWPQIVGIITTAVELIRTVVQAVLAGLRLFWERWGATILSVAERVWGLIQSTIRNALRIVQGLIDAVLGLITGDWSRAWGGIRNIVGGVWDQIKSLVGAAAGVVWDLVKGMMSNLWQTVVDRWNDIIGWFRHLPSRLTGAIPNPGSILTGIGRAIISGLWDGMKARWESVQSWLSDLADQIRNLKGPIEKDRVLLTDIGREIIGGLGRGMESEWGQIERLLGTMTAEIPVTVAAGVSASAAGGHAGRDGRTVNVTVHNPAPEPASVSVSRQMRKLAVAGVFDDV